MLPTAFDVLKIVLALLPAFAVGLAVFRQSKLVAAFAQLNDLQERGERQQALAKKAIEVDKEWFMIGVTNMVLSAYIVGAFPPLYFVYFTPKVLSLIGLRLVKFYRRKQHFLLWDFCYWANFLCIFYCWVMPKSPRVFRVVFMCANGPLAWSVLAFNHAMVFHSYAHMTSVVVHVSPLLLSYGLRWSAAPVSEDSIGSHHFRVCESQESCNDISAFQLIWETLTGFYLWWLVLYYVWIFIALGSYIEKHSYQTLWDRILVMKPVGPFLQNMLKKFPKLLVQLVYLLIHLAFSVATMLVAVLMWRSQIAHFTFLSAIVLSTIKNAGDFYMDVISSKYEEAASNAKVPVSKKILSASGALADVMLGPVQDQSEERTQKDLLLIEPDLVQMAKGLKCNFLAVEYPGYGLCARSKGCEEISFEGVEDVALHALVYCVSVRGIPPEKVLLHGRSLGSGPVLRLAKRARDLMRWHIGGVVLQCPFISIRQVAADYVGLPGSYLIPKDCYNNLDALQELCLEPLNSWVPILILHGELDKVIKPYHGRALLQKAVETGHPQVEGVFPPHASHNHWSLREDVVKPMQAFCQRHVAGWREQQAFWSGESISLKCF
ncbi:gpc1 [Symbiodinium sp. CCMP2592]|nr:gpc1 [Symbiodinium sp. CCMP2592]